MKHRRALLAIRHSPAARLSAVLALLAHFLVGLSPLWVPAVERAGIEVCTASGTKVVPVNSSLPGTPSDEQTSAAQCPLCALHAAALLPAADCALESLVQECAAFSQSVPKRAISGLFDGFNHLSRAPPFLS